LTAAALALSLFFLAAEEEKGAMSNLDLKEQGG
jgi:hypothetical protein